MQVTISDYHQLRLELRKFFNGSGADRLRFKTRAMSNRTYYTVLSELLERFDEAQSARHMVNTTFTFDVDGVEYNAIIAFIDFVGENND
ncbi:MAG: hypothetical protein ACRDCE_00335 [Cetobacterium sp.]|uniref:hypothetical protein n=1 Tax=Cetobacterium sp. TaxID=2071632 RepID=UPI003EE45631